MAAKKTPILPHETLHALGIAPSTVTEVTRLRQNHGHALYQFISNRTSFVLKHFPESSQAIEVRAYALLNQLGVPTLQVYAQTENALLLEDLTTSAAWRLATEKDIRQASTGEAVAEWYKKLHAVGETLINTTNRPQWLHPREIDALDAATIIALGERLHLADHPVWQLFAAHRDAIRQAIHNLPTTVTYNDFHWTNLALSRHESTNAQAIIFDYHLLGIGMRYSDYRNVSTALGNAARTAFQTCYGSVNEREACFDAPVSVMFSLSEAMKRPQLPKWGEPLVEEVTDGRLETKLQKAIEALY